MKIEVISKELYEEYHKNHIDMWMWLSCHPECNKVDYCEEHEISILDQCWACKAAEDTRVRLSDRARKWINSVDWRKYNICSVCIFCPLKNAFGTSGCNSFYQEYDRLSYGKYVLQRKSILASLVAHSPWYDYIDYYNTKQRLLAHLTNLRQWRALYGED